MPTAFPSLAVRVSVRRSHTPCVCVSPVPSASILSCATSAASSLFNPSNTEGGSMLDRNEWVLIRSWNNLRKRRNWERLCDSNNKQNKQESKEKERGEKQSNQEKKRRAHGEHKWAAKKERGYVLSCVQASHLRLCIVRRFQVHHTARKQDATNAWQGSLHDRSSQQVRIALTHASAPKKRRPTNMQQMQRRTNTKDTP